MATIDHDPNVIRQNIPEPIPGESLGHLPSGYSDGGGAPSETYTIPSCGISDCDMALHKLFNETIKFSTRTYGGGQNPIYIQKPKVIFATGEKFALAKKLRPPRDKNQVLLLPAISIRRTGIEQTAEDITGRGMNQFTGDLIIKKRLSPEDKDFQSILNKYAFKNIATPPNSTDINKTEELKEEKDVLEGVYLAPNLGQNIFEIFTIPQPQFFTATYEVIFWTSYHQHMNYLIETFLSSFLPQGRMFRLGTDKGYWFLGHVDESFGSQDNFDDFSSSERLIRYNFTMKVQRFILAPNGPGNSIPVRRYLSAPTVTFDVSESPTGDILTDRDLTVPPLEDKNDSRFILSDINEDQKNKQIPPTDQRFLFKKTYIDPITGKKTIKYIKKRKTNQRKGESTYSVSDIGTLQEFLISGQKKEPT